jgi:hypothetical protein
VTAAPRHYRIVGQGFVVGITAHGGIVREAAPYLRRVMLGRSVAELHNLCRRRRWTIERLTNHVRNGHAR